MLAPPTNIVPLGCIFFFFLLNCPRVAKCIQTCQCNHWFKPGTIQGLRPGTETEATWQQGKLRTGNWGWRTGESLGMEVSAWSSVSLNPSSSRIPSKTLKSCYDKGTRVLTLAHSQITSDCCMIENSITKRDLGNICMQQAISEACAFDCDWQQVCQVKKHVFHSETFCSAADVHHLRLSPAHGQRQATSMVAKSNEGRHVVGTRGFSWIFIMPK